MPTGFHAAGRCAPPAVAQWACITRFGRGATDRAGTRIIRAFSGEFANRHRFVAADDHHAAPGRRRPAGRCTRHRSDVGEASRLRSVAETGIVTRHSVESRSRPRCDRDRRCSGEVEDVVRAKDRQSGGQNVGKNCGCDVRRCLATPYGSHGPGGGFSNGASESGCP